MTKLKKVKTPEEIAAHEEAKRIRRVIKSLICKVKNQCREAGLRVVELQYEYLKANDTKLPTELDKPTTLNCYEEGLQAYRESLVN